jgi:transposase
MYSVDIYNRVRRACLKDGMSAREAARYFNMDRKTIAKMLRHELPPGYRHSEPPHRPTLDVYVGVIDELLRSNKALIKKTALHLKAHFERLRDEYGYVGSLTTVTYFVREQKRRTKEVFLPLSHRPGHAQVDFGETLGVIGGVECKIHF